MFSDLPIHPAVVHLPLALTLILPAITVLLVILIRRGVLEKSSILLLIFLHLLLVGGGYAALETGEDEEHVVERVLAERFIETHEERAEQFVVGSSIALALALGLWFFPLNLLVIPGLSILLTLQLIVGFLGYRVGHSGGELVYVHGAGRAYTGLDKNQRDFNAGEMKNSPASRKGADDDDDDDD